MNKIALLGRANSGKSYSRTFLNGEECLLLMPTKKFTYLYKKDGSLVDELTISSDKEPDPEKFLDIIIKRSGKKPIPDVPTTINTMSTLIKTVGLNSQEKLSNLIYNGNYLFVDDFTRLEFILHYVSAYMPHIKVVILADFTHYMSNYVKTKKFMERGVGAAQYEKYVIMAVRALDVFFSGVMNHLRDDLVVVTEYHIEDRDDGKRVKGNIFVPAGNMLNDWFKPESYFDILLGTYVIPADEQPVKSLRYKFVTSQISSDYKFCRDMSMFDKDLIPNNLDLVINALREKKKDVNYVCNID